LHSPISSAFRAHVLADSKSAASDGIYAETIPLAERLTGEGHCCWTYNIKIIDFSFATLLKMMMAFLTAVMTGDTDQVGRTGTTQSRPSRAFALTPALPG
jgi:hypothetical protein